MDCLQSGRLARLDADAYAAEVKKARGRSQPLSVARLKRAQSLRQSILRHAFTGQLVPQDPNDEPAAELLKRIAAERAERARQAASAKRTTKALRTALSKRKKGG